MQVSIGRFKPVVYVAVYNDHRSRGRDRLTAGETQLYARLEAAGTEVDTCS
jgi:hypothetical protein